MWTVELEVPLITSNGHICRICFGVWHRNTHKIRTIIYLSKFVGNTDFVCLVFILLAEPNFEKPRHKTYCYTRFWCKISWSQSFRMIDEKVFESDMLHTHTFKQMYKKAIWTEIYKSQFVSLFSSPTYREKRIDEQ